MTERKILVYAGADGTEYDGEFSEKDKESLKKRFIKARYIGYLSGYRYSQNATVGVMAFFRIKPTSAEIQKRRDNGFKAAKWNWF